MVVQVLGGDVGVRRHVVGNVQHSPLLQTVRGRFDDGVRGARGYHLRQVVLHCRRIRSGRVKPGVQLASGDGGRDRRDRAGGEPRRLEDREHDARRRRLAVGARYADDPQVARREAVLRGGQPGQRRPTVGDDHARHARRQDRQRPGRLSDDRGGAPGERVGDEAVTVDGHAPVGDEDRAGARGPAVGRHAGDRRVAGRDNLYPVESGG